MYLLIGVLDKWKGVYAIVNHFHRVSLYDTLPVVQKTVRPIPVPQAINNQWRHQLNTKRALNWHMCWTFHSIPIQIILLNAFFASTSKKILGGKLFVQSCLKPWNVRSIPSLSPAHSWPYWHSMVSSGTLTFSKILANRRLQVSLVIRISQSYKVYVNL